MTDPARFPGEPPRPPTINVGPRPGRLHRWKQTQPVRLYCYTVLAAVVVALVLAGTVTQEWADALLGIAAAVLAVVPGAEAARLSVYSPAGMTARLLRSPDGGFHLELAPGQLVQGGHVNLTDGRE